MITKLRLVDGEDKDIVMEGLAAELEHALRLRRCCPDGDRNAYIRRVNRICNLMTQIDGRVRPVLREYPTDR